MIPTATLIYDNDKKRYYIEDPTNKGLWIDITAHVFEMEVGEDLNGFHHVKIGLFFHNLEIVQK